MVKVIKFRQIFSGGFNNIELTVMFTHIYLQAVDELSSTGEEADKCILLHTIWANDTNIFVMALYFTRRNVLLHMDSVKIIHVPSLAGAHGHAILLPFLHSNDRGDITSFMCNIGKGQCLKLGTGTPLLSVHSLHIV